MWFFLLSILGELMISSSLLIVYQLLGTAA